MRYLIYISLFIPVFCFSQTNNNRTDISYNWQKLLTFDGASNNDSIGKFYACYSYDTIGTITFSLDSGSSAYGITSSTGMIYISNNTYLTCGLDTIKVQVCDNGASCGIYYGLIRIKDEDSCIFVDPNYSGTESGTLSQPYNAWTDISSFDPGYCYLQKRGTSTTTTLILTEIEATASSPTIVGAYSTGANPIITGNSGEAGIFFGTWAGTGCKYIEVYNYYLTSRTNGPGIFLDATNDAHNIEIWSCTSNGCYGNNAGMYAKEDYQTDPVDLAYGFYNCESYNGTSVHGFKFNRETDAINCYAHDNDYHGISGHDRDIYRYNYCVDNGQSGIEIQGDSLLVEYNICNNNNLAGIEHSGDDENWSYSIIRNNTIFNQRDQGIGLYDATGIIVEYNNVYENGQAGNYFDRWGINLQHAVDCIVRYNAVYDNVDGGIRIRNDGAGQYCSNDSIYYNWVDESPAKAIGMYEGNGDNIYIFNNTIYLDSIYESSSNYNVTCYGNIAEYIDSDAGSNNLLMNSDTIFTDASSHNFTLNPDKATNAIDLGYDWGQTRDFDGNSKNGSEWDIGAYEYESNRLFSKKGGQYFNTLKKGITYEFYKTK